MRFISKTQPLKPTRSLSEAIALRLWPQQGGVGYLDPHHIHLKESATQRAKAGNGTPFPMTDFDDAKNLRKLKNWKARK